MLKRLTPLGNSLALVIDKPTRRLLGLSPSTRVRVITDGRRLVVEPVRDDEVDPTLEPSARESGGKGARGQRSREKQKGVMETGVMEKDVMEKDVMEKDVTEMGEGQTGEGQTGEGQTGEGQTGTAGQGRTFQRAGGAVDRAAIRDPQHRTDLELFLDARRVLDALLDEHGLTVDVFGKLQRLYPRPMVYAGWLSFARASSVDAEHRRVIRRLDCCLQRRRDGASWDEVLAELACEEASSRSAS